MKPILFNTEMVRAILEGRKTVTRRVVKPQPDERHQHKLGYVTDSTDKKTIGYFGFGIDEYGGSIQYAKPPYKVNDILYVRETWRWLPCFECGRDLWAVPCKEGKFNHTYGNTGCYVFKADIHNCDADYFNWKSSIHMPKEAARIFLRVTAVRVERLQDITEEQAIAEGVTVSEDDKEVLYTEVSEFAYLWDDTIKKARRNTYGWDANPYVWVIEFERITQEQAEEKVAAVVT